MNSSGLMELWGGANTLICQIDKDGITMFCHDGRTIKINAEDGFVGYAANGDKIYWVSESNFHMKKSVVEDEITIANGLRFISINTDNYVIFNAFKAITGIISFLDFPLLI